MAPKVTAAADLKEVNFSAAVHNLGYINLHVGMHAGIFEKNGLKMNVTTAGGDTQTFAKQALGPVQLHDPAQIHGRDLMGDVTYQAQIVRDKQYR